MIVLDINSIIVYVACIIFLFLIGKFFIIPLKSIAKIIGNSILGGVLIFIINIIGNMFNFHIGLNIGTALITGILGVPRSNFAYIIKNIYRVILKINKIKSIILKNVERRFCLWTISKLHKVPNCINMGGTKNLKLKMRHKKLLRN